MVSARFVVFFAASAAPSVLGMASYSSKIPNGSALGKELGHSGSGYTAFGKMFSSSGTSWAAVCKQPWPDQGSVTVGAVLGDPCCKWTSGTPDYPLSAPNLSGTVCASAATAAAPPPAAASPAAASPVMSPASAPAAAPAAVPAALPSASTGKTSVAGGKGEVLCEAA